MNVPKSKKSKSLKRKTKRVSDKKKNVETAVNPFTPTFSQDIAYTEESWDYMNEIGDLKYE